MNKADSPSTIVYAAAGRIDAASAPLLDRELRALYDEGVGEIILDLTQVTYMSSSGLRILLLAQRRQQKAGGRLLLRNIPERIAHVLRVAGFDRVFEIEGGAPAPGQGHVA